MTTLPKIGDLRFHDAWGVGKIRTITPSDRPDAVIDFEHRPGHTASLAWLERETSRVSVDGFRALYFDNYDRAQQVLNEDPVLALEMALRDFTNGRAKTEDLKQYLGPYVNWEDWWEKAQPLVKAAPHIDTSRARVREYALRRDELSPAEEAFQSFRKRRMLGDHARAYTEARRALQLSISGQSLDAQAHDNLAGYFEGVRSDPQQPISRRLDLVFRLVEAGWVSQAQGDAEVEQLLTPGLRLDDLDEYAQNRMLGLLERRPPTEAGLALLVSGLAGADSVIKSAVNRIIRLGESKWMVAALQRGLTERLPDQPAESQAFAARLQACIDLVNCIPAAETDWPAVAGWLGALCAHCAAKVASREQLAKFNFAELGRLVHAIHSGVLTGQPESAPQVLAAAVNTLYGTPYLTGFFLALQAGTHVPPTFLGAIRDQIALNAGPTHDVLRAVLFGDDRLSAEDMVRHYTDVACAWATHDTNLGWAANQVIDLAKTMEARRLQPILVHLDRLASIGQGRAWHDAMEGQRERAYSFLLTQVLGGIIQSRSQPFGVLDPTVMGALQTALTHRLSETQDELKALEEQLGAARADLEVARSRVSQGEIVLGEVGRERRGRAEELRFEERFRLMQELARSVAEIERFAARQGSPSAEVKALLLRLTSILRGNKVEVGALQGATVAFDPSFCQLVSGELPTPGEQVRVAETGYFIRDHLGNKRLLKPALVLREATT
jgi:hypothetical protein